eukprot:m.98438 g.98438  ORF g.98438 m.98438 type:complete len:79 (+) comp15276_c0_seq1:1571-1807(+)
MSNGSDESSSRSSMFPDLVTQAAIEVMRKMRAYISLTPLDAITFVVQKQLAQQQMAPHTEATAPMLALSVLVLVAIGR